jgi:hypothetical protein
LDNKPARYKHITTGVGVVYNLNLGLVVIALASLI